MNRALSAAKTGARVIGSHTQHRGHSTVFLLRLGLIGQQRQPVRLGRQNYAPPEFGGQLALDRGRRQRRLTPLIIGGTVTNMDIEFDPAKDALNQARHKGVSLQSAAEFDMATALVAIDDREYYGEDRWIAVGFIGPVVHVLVFAERNGRIRPISLRKALKREVRDYEKKKVQYGF